MGASKGTGRLTTHVLDTASGKPAAGLRIDLYSVTGGVSTKIKSIFTNDDGRCDDPLLANDDFSEGVYELVFCLGDYFSTEDKVAFLADVPVRFGVTNAEQHYHVPLLASPYGYSTYRGS